LTSTCVTFPELSTFRVAVSDEAPHEETEAFPAESFCEPRARVAAAPQAANVAATASAVPSAFARSFISVCPLKIGRLLRVEGPAARCLARNSSAGYETGA